MLGSLTARGRRQPRKRRFIVLKGAFALAAAVFGVMVGLQLTLYSSVAGKTGTPHSREALFALLQPVALSNCELQRFGEAHDGGYLMCANLLQDVQAGYSYGISGYDQWGCDVSTRRNVPVHQYDCFNTTVPACPTGRTNFHAECVGDTSTTTDGRRFDTIANQLQKNGDAAKRIVLKIDVEGAEWRSFLSTPDETLAQIDQLAVEFHGIEDQQSIAVVERLKKFFEVAHIHYNNASCLDAVAPFPSWAYEVLFVSKRLAVVDSSRKPSGVHPLDARNIPFFRDCQATP
jgi:hypothetical protein